MFFPEYSVSLFHESGYGYCIYFRRALAAMNCVYNVFDRYFKGALAAIHLSGTFIISGGHLQWSNIFKGTVFLWDKHLQSSLFSRILS